MWLYIVYGTLKRPPGRRCVHLVNTGDNPNGASTAVIHVSVCTSVDQLYLNIDIVNLCLCLRPRPRAPTAPPPLDLVGGA